MAQPAARLQATAPPSTLRHGGTQRTENCIHRRWCPSSPCFSVGVAVECLHSGWIPAMGRMRKQLWSVDRTCVRSPRPAASA
ncbi:unnamed protein product [Urochloa humidicola]